MATVTKESLLNRSRIPERYRSVTKDQIVFTTIRAKVEYEKTEHLTIKDTTQEAFYNQLFTNLNHGNPSASLRGYARTVICAASAPTDDKAMMAAMLLASSAASYADDAFVYDLGHMPTGWEDEKPELAIIHNIHTGSTPARLQFARDVVLWSLRHHAAVLVVAGGTDPVTFCDNYLRYEADEYLYSTGRSKRRAY